MMNRPRLSLTRIEYTLMGSSLGAWFQQALTRPPVVQPAALSSPNHFGEYDITVPLARLKGHAVQPLVELAAAVETAAQALQRESPNAMDLAEEAVRREEEVMNSLYWSMRRGSDAALSDALGGVGQAFRLNFAGLDREHRTIHLRLSPLPRCTEADQKEALRDLPQLQLRLKAVARSGENPVLNSDPWHLNQSVEAWVDRNHPDFDTPRAPAPAGLSSIVLESLPTHIPAAHDAVHWMRENWMEFRELLRQLGATDLRPLGDWNRSAVFSLGPRLILKAHYPETDLEERPGFCPPPLLRKAVGGGSLVLQVLPRLETRGVRQEHVDALCARAREEGWVLSDVKRDNVALGPAGRPFWIDEEGFWQERESREQKGSRNNRPAARALK